MPREIIGVQVGQCGNQVGNAVWEALFDEHAINGDGRWDPKLSNNRDEDGDGLPDELECAGVYFNEQKGDSFKSSKWLPRNILVDLEPGTMDNLNNLPHGSLSKTDWQFKGANGAGNNWAKGHYTEGAELVEEVLEGIRKATEGCECPQAFQLIHSLGGGTGSGMGTLLLLKIRDTYPDKITCTYSIFPSPKVSDTVVEPYNAVLSSHQLLENSDETFMIDNEALYNIMHNVVKKTTVEYSVLNRLIAQVACGVTASIRFPGMLNGDLRKLGVNLVPFPRLHFFLVSQAPLTADATAIKDKIEVRTVLADGFSAKHYYSNVKPDDGKFLATAFTFRGNAEHVSSSTVDEHIEKLQSDKADLFVEWIPNNIKTGIVGVPSKTAEVSCTVVANSTALKGIFQRLATQFGAMYKRKAFLHWYKGEGMDEMEFQEADKNVRDLITEYQDKEDAVYEEEDENDDESEQT